MFHRASSRSQGPLNYGWVHIMPWSRCSRRLLSAKVARAQGSHAPYTRICVGSAQAARIGTLFAAFLLQSLLNVHLQKVHFHSYTVFSFSLAARKRLLMHSLQTVETVDNHQHLALCGSCNRLQKRFVCADHSCPMSAWRRIHTCFCVSPP